jgi:hypothetical protein
LRIVALTGRITMIMVPLAFCAELLAQNPQLRTRTGSRFPTVIYTSVLWSADPAYYSIAVDAAGTATYQSAPESVGRTGAPYTLEFHVSDRTRRTIFNVVRELDYFRGETPVQQVSTANDTARTLMYHDLGFNTQLTYSRSSDSEIEELTSIFEEVSETVEYGRKLAYFEQHDKSKIAAELRALKADADRHFVRELQAIAPVLRSLAADTGLDAESRRSAQSLADASLAQRGTFGGTQTVSPQDHDH